MRNMTKLFLAVTAALLIAATVPPNTGNAVQVRVIVASDTILSGMIASLLPPDRYSVQAILPPGQCPGHYDVKPSDIERMKHADLTVSFRGMPFMEKTGPVGGPRLLVDAGNRNWMAPDSHTHGLGVLADELAKRFPADREIIKARKKEAVRTVKAAENMLIQKIRQAGIHGKAVIASSMQKEPLQWMGFRVVGEYGRPEAMSVRGIVRLTLIGRERQAVLVADNLQSGPETGRGIAEALGVPHVVLTNFPSEKGYVSTLGENVDAVLAAVRRK